MIDNDPRQIEMPLDDRKRCIKGNKTITSYADCMKKLRFLEENTRNHEAERLKDD